MATTFRLCRPREASSLLMLLQAMGHQPDRRFATAAAHSALGRALADPALGLVWLIVQGGGTVGYLCLSFRTVPGTRIRRAYVTGLWVLPPYRRRGIGPRALRFMEEFGRSVGVAVMSFGTSGEDKPAQCLFRQPNGPEIPDLFYSKDAIA